MSKISEARQALRDYAREQAAVVYTEPDPTSFSGQPGSAPMARGEAAGKAFVSTQAALTVAEELREESREPVATKVEVNGRQVPYPPESAYKDALAAAADRIEAAIVKALS